MVNFFPELYPDELLYSGIARYHVRVGNLDAKSTLRDLYDKDTITAVVEMTSNLDTLINNLPTVIYTADEIIRNHTMYPYFAAFIPKDRADRLYQLIKGNNGSKIYNELGLSNKILKLNNFLRFCPECYREDIDKYGETYWHRIHQVAGVDYCTFHKCRLLDSKISVRNKNRQEYIHAHLEIRKYDIEEMEREQKCSLFSNNENILEKFIVVAQNVKYLMDSNIRHQELNYFREIYLNKLIDLGLANRKKIFQDIILLKFKAYWGEEFLNSINCNFDIEKSSNWLTTITRKHRKGFHPIQHILFINFLGLDIKAIFEEEINVSRKTNIIIIKSDEEKSRYRYKWGKLMEEFPDESKTQIRKRDRSTYTWLYKYDNEWLKKNSPTKKVGSRKSQLIDWNKRDEEILTLVKEAVNDIKMSSDKPERITITLIAKKIKKETMLQKHMERLAKTKEFLHYKIESLEEFQLRRVKWAIKELAKNGDVKVWDVVLKAGLSKKYYYKLEKEIRNLIYKENLL